MNIFIPTRSLWTVSLVLGLLWLYTISMATESVQAYTGTSTSDDIHQLAVQATARDTGIGLEWQVTTAEAWTGFTVYTSMDCQWENAVTVTAPIFSSTHGETSMVTYSLLDDGSAVVQPCAYWVVGTAADGVEHRFGPAKVEARFDLYLPLVHH